jgi:hypothetical protein
MPELQGLTEVPNLKGNPVWKKMRVCAENGTGGNGIARSSSIKHSNDALLIYLL